jgi:hypothetical protein
VGITASDKKDVKLRDAVGNQGKKERHGASSKGLQKILFQ